MMRQSLSRNHKSKSLRVKSVLQICILGAVCFWLLYQLKHSYDKKRDFDERSSRAINGMADDRLDTVRLGRKDLPEGQIIVSNHQVNKEDEDGEDQEMKKIDVEHQEAVDDVIDEQDNEKDDEQDDQERGDEERGDEESEAGEDFNEEDNERHDDREEEIEFSDDQENEQSTSHKAHQESYNKDDASSAMPQEYNTTRTEDESGTMNKEHASFIEEKDVNKEEIAEVQDDSSASSNISDVLGINTTGNMSDQTNVPSAEQRVLRETTNNRDESVYDDHIQLFVNSTTLPPSENQEKFHTDSSVIAVSNQMEVGVSSANIDVVADNLPAENQSVNNSAVENQRIEFKVETSEHDHNDTKEEATPNRNDGVQILEDHQKEPLGVNENEDSIPGENGGSAKEVVTDVEREARIDLSTLSNVQAEAINIE